MDLELLTQESEKTQKEQLKRAKLLIKNGLESLNYNDFKTGIALLREFAKPSFTPEKQFELEKDFFDKLEIDLLKKGVLRNGKEILMPDEPKMKHEKIVFSLEGMDLFSITRKGNRHYVYQHYHEAKPLLPEYERRVEELENLISSKKIEVMMGEKLLQNPLFLFSSEFKNMEKYWMENHHSDKVSSVQKTLTSVQMIFSSQMKDGIMKKKEENVDALEEYQEILKNVKRNETKNRHHDAHLLEIKQKADTVLTGYQLFV